MSQHPSASTVAKVLGAWNREGGPAYRALAIGIRAAVLDGRIALDTRLPAERELAAALSTSRTTVAAGYAKLRDEGWLRSRRGSGSIVQLPNAAPAPSGLIWGAAAPDGDVIDLTTASLPAPLEPLQAALAAAAADLPAYAAGDGYFPLGLPELRDLIARRYADAGVPTTRDQIVITNGAQHAFTLILHELSNPGDRVLIECPTYPVALDAIRASRRIPATVALLTDTDEPWDVQLMHAVMSQSAPSIVYLQPEFQNPTGALMGDDVRREVVDVAKRAGAMLVIDESFRDVPFDAEMPMPQPMSAYDRDGRVLSIGSLSKPLWGGLRVGWIRASASLAMRLGAARALADMSGPVLDQLVAVHMLADPTDALAQQRSRLRCGYAALQSSLAEHAPDWACTSPQGGAVLWVKLPAPVATEAARLGPQAGVRVVPGPRFGPDGTMDAYLRLPFTAPTESLSAAVPRLVTVVAAAMESGKERYLDRWLT